MRNPFKRGEKALTGSPAVIQALGQGWEPWPLLGGGSRQRIMDIYNRAQGASYGWMYSTSPAVRTVIDVIVRNVGQLELRLFEEVDESERQPRPDHPAALSLRYPNEELSADKFIRELFLDFLIYSNSYALMLEAPSNRIAFNRIPAFMVEVQGASLWRADNYRVWPMGAWTSAGSWGGSGTWTDYTPQQVLHWHGENPLDPRVGLSLLDTIRDVVAEDAALQQATVELANAGLQEPAWIFRPLDAPQWSNDARMAFEEDVANRMRGRNRKPLALEEGMEVKSFGMSPRDAQMYEIRKWAIERVAALFGVPLGMVGLDPNVEAARAEFYANTLPPYCEEFTRMLNQRVLVRAYNWTDGSFEFNLDHKLMGDDRLRALTSATGRAVMLTNEARAKLNLPPVDGGDELVTPDNVTAGDNPKPSPQVMPIQDPGKPPQDGSYRQDQPPPPQAPKALTEHKQVLPQLHPTRKADLDRQRQNIDVMKAVVQRHFNRLGRSLQNKALLLESDTKDVGSKVDWKRWDAEFSDDIDGPLKGIVKTEGGIYMMKFAAAGNFEMTHVQNYLRAMAEGAAGAINDTIRSEIEQLGLDEAMNRASQHVAIAGSSLGARSTIWAREEAARQSGTFQQRIKTWIADTDRHAEWDGTTVALGDEWPSGFAPGSPPNCACTMTVS